MPPRPSPTHFLCLPLAGAQLAKSLSSFRADVTSALTFGLPEEAVRPLGTLHLTLGVMALKGDELDKAVNLLQSLKVGDVLKEARTAAAAAAARLRPSGDDHVEGGPVTTPTSTAAATASLSTNLSVTIRGLRSMQPPATATVLYAPPSDSEGILYDFCQRLRKSFHDSGLLVDEQRPLLLHATIFNTIYVRNRGRGRRGRSRYTLDARQVLSRYEDYMWAEELPITRLAICKMGAKQIEGTDDAAYEVEAEVGF